MVFKSIKVINASLCACRWMICLLWEAISNHETTKDMLSKCFEIQNMGVSDVILGIRIIRNSEGLKLSQSHYVEKILQRCCKRDFNQVKTPIDNSVTLE